MNPLIAQAISLRASGLTIAAIAAQLGRSKAMIHLYLSPDQLQKHRQRAKDASAASYRRDPALHKARRQAWIAANPEKNAAIRAESNRRYTAKNRWRTVLSRLEYRRLRSKDAGFQKSCELQAELLRGLFQKNSKVNMMHLCGCTAEQLRGYVTHLLPVLQDWSSYPDTWELGFKEPLIRWDLTFEPDAKEAFHYANLTVITPEQRRGQDRQEERFWKAPKTAPMPGHPSASPAAPDHG